MSIVDIYQSKLGRLFALTGLLFCIINNAHAERQSLTSITFQAESFLADYVYESPYPARFEVSALDPRLNLKPCTQPLSINFSRSDKVMGHTALKIRCHQPVKWQIHLPVRVDVFADVIVNKSPLLRGQTIDSNDIEYRKKNITQLFQGYYRQTDSLHQLQAKRNLAAKSVLNPANLSPRKLVKSGQQVTIVLNMGDLQIKSTGLALQSASRGQVIKVRNTQSNRVVEATVSGEAQVSVRL